jgi:hypothetical protein
MTTAALCALSVSVCPPYPQAFLVDFPRRTVTKALMLALIIVEAEPGAMLRSCCFFCDNPLEGVMLSDLDILLTAHLMMHEHGGEAELEAATQADRMLRRGDRNELLTWFRIWRTIAVMRQVPTGLPN